MRIATMLRSVELVSSNLRLTAGELVELTDAVNQPFWKTRGLVFARPVVNPEVRGFGIDRGILIERDDYRATESKV